MEFHKFIAGSQTVVPVGHSTRLLNTFHPDWWVCCFTDLFFRGDFRVPTGLGLRRWGALLIDRVDFRGWGLSKELAATVYNIVLRRSQMWNMYKYTQTSKA